MPRSARGAGGFTLVELLVVIAIIGTLMALLLPAVQMARESARRTSCVNNLRQIGTAIHLYHNTNNSLPPGSVSYGPCCSTPSYTGWTIQILPFLELKSLYEQYEQNVPNEEQPRRIPAFADHPYPDFRRQFVRVYSCPSDIYPKKPEIPESGPANDRRLEYMPGSYRGVGGRSDGVSGWWDISPRYEHLPRRWRGPFHVVDAKLQPENFASITDGLSNTLLVGEYCTRMSRTLTGLRRRTFWAYTHTTYNRSDVVPESRTLIGDLDRCTELGGSGDFQTCYRAWGSFHPEVVNFLFCDGSVRTIGLTVNMQYLADAATIAGREPGFLTVE
jgi:prepilin-type N-terminal cleavage/methylation domain-containing protein/prepilin-type processing-associated H-X9-DG protein